MSCTPGLRATRINAAEGSGLARAIDYSLKRWPALVRYAVLSKNFSCVKIGLCIFPYALNGVSS